jgi:hypothetical protein
MTGEHKGARIHGFINESARSEWKTTADVAVRELRPAEFREAARILGRGMSDNPANLQVFRMAEKQRRCRALTRFFEPVLQGLHKRGVVLGAYLESTMAGVCGAARPGLCQPSALEKLRLAPVAVNGNPICTTMRMMKRTVDWASRDLQVPHWHLGPVAVDPPFQHRGIGSAMMACFCTSIDAAGAMAYLETDKLENVSFYQRFRFLVIAEAEVLSVPNWFMSRAPGNGPAPRPV